ncbi:hypothetical protein A3E49_00215 [Candidatus Saccharibacteria bacterium RIFCSPHIGHO2_12_FULL_49_19]|nr:MAG: hypothetical protein A2708_01050 [Candidatus Saccharibacteria bacterium RIFCSPHIGHO2_01_FULL_49_21]OGL36919.1 MAG: hypothetical protein A3E49_00215 [Candidatus Saccharibacteria bacterium RIFCSPHIGHO2_12_FULL_49_19]OGL38105.1 MAG: hypothetical protein A3B63_02805 [Candidatus Saccharibacteria bacterium RIFCSPLOWO2_01_FULL_49_22]
MSTPRRAFGYAFSIALAVGLLLALWQRQAILDWWRLQSYTPPPEVVALATDTAMTDSARRVFYVNHPELTPNETQFRQDCPIAEQTIVLGCYHGPQSGIFIYNVSDIRLDGVEQVTAAHEMLHAQYDRLSSDERESIDRVLVSFYESSVTDERIRKTVDSYRQTEPNDVVNEMHSIFGTEIATLPSELETYYSRYFTDRSRVVDFSARYEAEFASRLGQIAAMDQQVAQLKQSIESQEKSLTDQLAVLENESSKLDFYQGSGDTETYNSLVPGYNARVQAYNSGVNKLKEDINDYNQLIAERNALAVELKGLEQAIDTRLTTQSTE